MSVRRYAARTPLEAAFTVLALRARGRRAWTRDLASREFETELDVDPLTWSNDVATSHQRSATPDLLRHDR
jgi:hypothetical protein